MGIRLRTGTTNGDDDPDPPKLSVGITSPTEDLAAWNGMPLPITGVASFDPVIKDRAVTVSINDNSAPAKLTGGPRDYKWERAYVVTDGGGVAIEAVASGTYLYKGQKQDIASDPSSVGITITLDTAPPMVVIADPQPDQQITSDPKGTKIKVSGTASDLDPGTGVNSVTVSVDGGPPVAAQLDPPAPKKGDTVLWSAEVTLPPIVGATDNGQRLITVKCRDNAGPGNVGTRTVTVYLGLEFTTADPNDSLSSIAYLRDLIDFATRRIKTPAGGLRAPDLKSNFYQPFVDLLSKDEDVPQARIGIEVLRGYLPTDPVACWNFDEGTGPVAADSSPNGLNGTLQGATWTDASGLFGRFYGKFGSALAFDGKSYVQVGNQPKLRMSKAVSMAAWVYPKGPGTPAKGGIILNKEGEYEVGRLPDGSIQWAFANADPGWNWTNTGQSALPDRWTHIAVVYDLGEVRTYVNGRLAHTHKGAGEIGSVGATNHELRIGGREELAQFFDGNIDEVRVFNRALTTDEVLLLFEDPRLQAGSAAYRLAAYESLLANIGTSYQELRLARGADSRSRTALANRLGFDLEAAGPDKLDVLLLRPREITERKLEELFGFRDTTRNPLSPPPEAVPELVRWRRERLRRLWLQEDEQLAGASDFAAPIIDPDLLGEGDFVQPVSGTRNPALDVWTTRTEWVNDQVGKMAADRLPGENDQARLDRLVSTKVEKMDDLLKLHDSYRAGTSIAEKLAPIPISFAAFAYLIRLHNLAAKQPLLDEEWAAAYSINTQVSKARKLKDWRGEEAAPPNAPPIVLGPEQFRIPGRTPVPTVWSTGFADGDAGGFLLPDGGPDDHWEILLPNRSWTAAVATKLTENSSDDWLANSTTSRWIGPQANERPGDQPGDYTYYTSFNLDRFDPATLRIAAKVAVDDRITDVRLNGRSLGLAVTGFQAFTSFEIRGPFLPDNNSLEVVVHNMDFGVNPTGLRAELSATGMLRPAPMPEWRATGEQRRKWENKLAARIEQWRAIEEGLLAAVALTEETTLPSLRDTLVETISAVVPSAAGLSAADWLTERLLIDTRTSGAIKTTRVTQAIQTLQGVLFSVRIGRFGIIGIPGLKQWQLAIDPGDFDKDWAWMGAYDTWRAAMEVFLYPENVLLPSLRGTATEYFKALVKALRQAQPVSDGLPKLLETAFTSYTADPKSPQDPKLPQDLKDEIAKIKSLILGALPPGDLISIAEQERKIFDNHPDLLEYCAEALYFIPVHLALQLHVAGRFTDALACFRAVYAYDLALENRKIYYGLRYEENIASKYQRSDVWLRDLDPHFIALTRANALTRFTLLSLLRCFLAFGDAEFARGTAEDLPQARELYLNALELLNAPEMQTTSEAPFQPNPILQGLRTHAEVNLFKLRNGRNIAGMRQATTPLLATGPGLAANGAGPFSLQPLPAPQPTPYRYSALAERAKQLVQLAAQIEASYLAAAEKTDIERYNLLKANGDLELASATVQLHALRVKEASDGVSLARDQNARAQTQFDTYDAWIKAGPLDSERDMIEQYRTAQDFKNVLAGLDAAITAGQAASSVVLPWQWAIAGTVSALATGRAVAQGLLNAAEAQAQIDAANSSFERRQQEWQLQRSLAQNDLITSDDQIRLSSDRVDIAIQDQSISRIQDAHDQAVVNFLNAKFTNAELYEWMSGVLGGVYRYFLQQAAAMAQLAQTQLSFERQERGLVFIKADYWQPPSETAGAKSSASDGNPDRRGLTGSARLLQDIYQLDQYAFQTNQRKLQLSKSISLARLAPFEFQQFRRAGVLPFATPMSLFDRDFPGHYLRLIKRVRTSVVALIPPTQGVKATLANTGVSRVTLGGDVFRTTVIQRDPELVALTSPMNATGLFELDTQPELLLPFEGTGVDALWEFRMPMAANPFDYTTIADILITLEYTALDSTEYRKQVITQLTREISLERAFSFREQWPDQWYALNNPDQSEKPLTVQVDTNAADFPPNLEELRIEHVAIHFVRADAFVFDLDVSLKVITEDLPRKTVGGNAISIDGTISTRRGNAAEWIESGMIGRSPVGQWTLAILDTPEHPAREHFKDEHVEDILFILTYGGLTPAWPRE
jgi:hypothetical protein